MVRPLTLLGLGDEGARSLGLPLGVYRVAGLGAAVALIAFVVAAVGVIGFVGLAAATLARIGGARRLGQRLLMAPLVGAALLWAADQAVQLATGPQGDLLPTGAITALLGAPLLLWLLPRLALASEAPALTAEHLPRSRRPGLGWQRSACPWLCWSGLPCCWGRGRMAGVLLSAISFSPCCHGAGRASRQRSPPAPCWRWPG
ncbi:hypothetical protein AJ88_15940 [Mesorhizobium amorphae CCBAU 01583]|nr:hypothetical protein AJ88_15940 [Mesorhizobium amorphae CCBAU 01583]